MHRTAFERLRLRTGIRLMQSGTDHRHDDTPVECGTLEQALEALYDLYRHRDSSTLAQTIASAVSKATVMRELSATPGKP